MKEYQMCRRCVMDNRSDDTISFDEQGYCNYCTTAIKQIGTVYLPNDEGKKQLELMIAKLKKEGEGKKYDCLMGISGGLDSAYLAYLGAVKWELRILAVHIDDGFDTQLAKDNISNLCKACGIEIIYEYPDKEQFNDLTRAFILAEVPNIAIPQDNAILAYLYNYARKYKTYNFLSGSNFALECILQKGNTFTAFDLIHIKDIHERFGTKSLSKLTLLSKWRILFEGFVNNQKTLRPLNYINYDKAKAISELNEFCGFTYYEAKHLENIFTKVAQLVWFAKKFRVDKRHSHLSSLIVSGQMTRDEAIVELQKLMYDEEKMEYDTQFVLNELNITREEFDKLLSQPGKQHTEYKKYSNVSNTLYKLLLKISMFLKRL